MRFVTLLTLVCVALPSFAGSSEAIAPSKAAAPSQAVSPNQAVAPNQAAAPNERLTLASDARATVLRLLSGYEWQLLPASFQRLPADVYVTLINIAGDDSLVAYTRGRAMAALSLYENDTVFAFFYAVASDSLHGAERRRAVEGLCEIFSGTKPAEIRDLLMPMLKSGDVHLRIRAAVCLTRLQETQPDAALEAQLAAYGQSIEEDWELQAAGLVVNEENKGKLQE